MKVILERSLLFRALHHAQNIADRRAISSVLSNVLLMAQDSELTITATDLDITLQERMPARIEEEGAVTIPAHLAYDIVRKLPDGAEIELIEKPDSSQLILKSGKTKFSLPTLPAKDFSPLKVVELPHQFSLKSTALNFLLSTTRFSISTEETRYYLNGIYFHLHVKGNEMVLRAVSTDGHRLSLAEVEEPKGASGMPNVIIPRKTIFETMKLLEENNGEVEISLSHTQIKFQIGRVTLISRLIDGTFPDYEKVIPSGTMSALEIERSLFMNAVDRVSTIANDKMRGVKLTIEPHKIIVSATGSDQAMGSEEVEAHYDGKRLCLGFNARYLLDIASQITEENIILYFSDDQSPTLIKGKDKEEALYVLMPMRL